MTLVNLMWMKAGSGDGSGITRQDFFNFVTNKVTIVKLPSSVTWEPRTNSRSLLI